MRKKSAKIRKWQEEFASIDDRDLLDLSRYNDEKAKMSILMGNLPKEVISLIVLNLPTIPYHFRLRRLSSTWNKFLNSDMIKHFTTNIVFSMHPLPKQDQVLSLLNSYTYVDAKNNIINSLKRVVFSKYCYNTGAQLSFFAKIFEICTFMEEFGLIFDTPLFDFSSFAKSMPNIKKLDISGTLFGMHYYPDEFVDSKIQEITCHYTYSEENLQHLFPKAKIIHGYHFDNFDFLETKEGEAKCREYLSSIDFNPYTTPLHTALVNKMTELLIFSVKAWKFVLSLKPYKVELWNTENKSEGIFSVINSRYNIAFVVDCLNYITNYSTKLQLLVLFLDYNIPVAQEFISGPSQYLEDRQQILYNLAAFLFKYPDRLHFRTPLEILNNIGDGHSFLSVAIHLSCSEKMCRKLLKGGCSVEAYIGNKQYCSTAVHLAAHKGREDLLELFIDRAPHLLNAFNGFQQTPLMICCLNGHLRAVKKLLQLGASLLVRDMDFNTPLHGAILGKNQDFALYLIENYGDKMDLNCYNANQESPLWLACAYELEEVAFWLLMKGANPKGEYMLSGVWNKPEISPHELALKKGNWKMASMIKQHLKRTCKIN